MRADGRHSAGDRPRGPRIGSRGSKTRRVQRVGRLILQVVSETIVSGLQDPHVQFVTVTGVEVSPDMRFADAGISVLGDEKQQKLCLAAIRRAHGFIQDRVAEAVSMKFCPVLRFCLDDSVKKSVRLGALIAKARAEDEAARADRIRRGAEEPLATDEFDEADKADEADDEGT